MRFDGKVAIVTGAASPIGQAIVRRLAAGGARLVLGDVAEDALRDTAGRLVPDALVVAGDLSREPAAQALVDTAREAYGRVDILINNAGGGVILPTFEHDSESIRRTIDRNLWTAIWCSRAVLPLMVDNDYGRIVSVGADSVRNGLYEHAIYNAAKGGVHAMATGLAREFARYDITVNVVAPCMVLTPQVRAAKEAGHPTVAAMEAVIPKGRSADPDEVASMVAYLALDEARFVTGQTISVNGGSTML